MTTEPLDLSAVEFAVNEAMTPTERAAFGHVKVALRPKGWLFRAMARGGLSISRPVPEGFVTTSKVNVSVKGMTMLFLTEPKDTEVSFAVDILIVLRKFTHIFARIKPKLVKEHV